MQSGSNHWFVTVSPLRGRAEKRALSFGTAAKLSLGDLAIVLLLVFFGVSGAIPGIAPNQASAMTGTPASHLQAVVGIGSQLLVNLFICALLLRYARLLRHHAALLWCPLALGCWAAASVCWSVDPLLTGRRAIPFLLAAGFGALLAIRLPPQRLLFLLLAAFAMLALWSAVLAVAFPPIGLDASTGHGGDWQGVFTQKNACGRAMVLALAALFAQISGRPRWSPPKLWQFALCLLFSTELVLSGSRGAWVIACVVLCVLPALQATGGLRPRFRAAILVSVSGLIVALALAAATHFAQLAPLLGRDATLSGRTEIWRQVWIAIMHRPLLGYGFSAFWQGFSGPSWDVVVALHFVLFHAHNGFLEIWIELGAFGLVIFSATFLRAVILLWPELRAGRFARSAWPLTILSLAVLYDIDENTLLAFNGLFWVLYSGALVRIELLAAERRPISRRLPCYAVLAAALSAARKRAEAGAAMPPSPLAIRAAESPWL